MARQTPHWRELGIHHHPSRSLGVGSASRPARYRQGKADREPANHRGLVSHWQEKARPVGVAGSQGGLFLVGDPVGDPVS
jgi:hypothetical protein